MVQNVSAQQGYGSINRMGMTQDGRVLYQVIAADGKEAGKMTVPQHQADSFEKSYRTMIKNAPKMQEFAMTATPEKVEKMQKKAKWITAGGALLGGLTPMVLLRSTGKGKWWGHWATQTVATLIGLVGGLIGGSKIAAKVATPPGSMDFMKATQTISQLDIQPYGQNLNQQV